MARGDKNYTEVVRKVNDGQSANAKIAAIHAMVEALIQEDNEEAVEQLRAYMQIKARQILLGEEDDDEMEDADDDSSDDSDGDDDSSDDDSDDDDGDDDSDDSDDDDGDDDGDDEEYEEDEEKSKKKKVKEHMVADEARARTSMHHHGNDAPKLDRGIKGNKYKTKPHRGERKGKDQEFHGNNAPHLDRGVKGDVFSKKPHRANLTGSGSQEFHETPPSPRDDNKSDHRVSQKSNRV